MFRNPNPTGSRVVSGDLHPLHHHNQLTCKLNIINAFFISIVIKRPGLKCKAAKRKPEAISTFSKTRGARPMYRSPMKLRRIRPAHTRPMTLFYPMKRPSHQKLKRVGDKRDSDLSLWLYWKSKMAKMKQSESISTFSKTIGDRPSYTRPSHKTLK